MSQSVSQSVTENELNALQIAIFLPPIFTKLATKVESQEMWLPIVFGGNPKYFYPPTSVVLVIGFNFSYRYY